MTTDMTAGRADMELLMRPRYRSMPDPIETADDRDQSKPPAIRYVDFGGDYDDYFEINVIGPYPDRTARDRDLARLRNLPGEDGYAQFFPDRLGSIRADKVVDPARIAAATTMVGFFAGWTGCTEAEWLGADPEGDDIHPDQAALPL